MYPIIAWVFCFEKSKFCGKRSNTKRFGNVDNVDKYIWKSMGHGKIRGYALWKK
jgi:hypothetical protein